MKVKVISVCLCTPVCVCRQKNKWSGVNLSAGIQFYKSSKHAIRYGESLQDIKKRERAVCITCDEQSQEELQKFCLPNLVPVTWTSIPTPQRTCCLGFRSHQVLDEFLPSTN